MIGPLLLLLLLPGVLLTGGLAPMETGRLGDRGCQLHQYDEHLHPHAGKLLPDADQLLPDADQLFPDSDWLWPHADGAAVAGLIWCPAGPAGYFTTRGERACRRDQ